MIRTNQWTKVLLLAGALLLGGVLIADTALGQDAGASDELLVVDDDGADCPDAGYATIQPAVDEALEGQTVRVCPGTYAGSVEISVEDLKLLGQDAILDGEQSRTNGITVDAQSVEVQGFTILNYKESGIRVNADDVLLEKNTVKQNEGGGVKVRFGTQATVRETTALNNQGTGIVVSGADGSVVVDNRVEDNTGLGISGGFISSSEIVVVDNTVTGNEGTGIFFFRSDDIEVRNNSVSDGIRHGIRMVGARPVVEDNTVEDHDRVGILLEGEAATVQGNTVTGSDEQGIILVNAENSVVSANRITENAWTGLIMANAGSSEVAQNIVDRNARHGIQVQGGIGSAVHDNTVTDNGQGGISVTEWFGAAAGDVKVSANEIVANRIGVDVSGNVYGASVNDNNIRYHAEGLGLVATSAEGPVEANENWWGCPDGPDAPECEDVAGNALFTSWRSEPNPEAGADGPSGASTTDDASSSDEDPLLWPLPRVGDRPTRTPIGVAQPTVGGPTPGSAIQLLETETNPTGSLSGAPVAPSELTEEAGVGSVADVTSRAQGADVAAASEDASFDDRCQALDSHPPIWIYENHGPNGFTWTNPETGEDEYRPGSGVVAGNGTAEDPYVIEGWCIDGRESWEEAPDIDDGILVFGRASANVTFQNNAIGHHEEEGLRTDGTNVISVENNTLKENKAGIRLRMAPGVAVVNNTAIDHRWQGIRLQKSPGPAVLNNTVVNASHHGISVSESEQADVRDNTATNSHNGLYVSSHGAVVEDNVALGNDEHGLFLNTWRLSNGDSGVAQRNVMTTNGRDGIFLDDTDGWLVRDNEATGNGEDGLSLRDADDVTIRNMTLTDNDRRGLHLETSHDVSAQNLTATDNKEDGIRLTSSDRPSIADTRANGNQAHGVHVFNTDATLDTITANDNGNDGVYANFSPLHLRDSTATGNAGQGVHVWLSEDWMVANTTAKANGNDGLHVWNARNATVEANSFTANDQDGIDQRRSDALLQDNLLSENQRYGLHATGSFDTTVQENTVRANAAAGVFIDDAFATASGLLLEANQITDNDEGIHVEGAAPGAIFHENNIFDNTEGTGLDALAAETEVDARENWWGCSGGPEAAACDDVSGNAVYDPWLDDSLQFEIEILAASQHTVSEGQTATIDIATMAPEDAGSIALSATGLPANATFTDHNDGTGTLAWATEIGDAGSYEVTFTASDGNETAEHATTILVEENLPPQIEPIPEQVVQEDIPVELAITASDHNGDPITLNANQLPANATFTDHGDGTGTFAWTPRAGDIGTHTLSVEAADAWGTTTRSATIHVEAAVPTLGLHDPVEHSTDLATTTLIVDEPVQLAAEITDANGDITDVEVYPRGPANASMQAAWIAEDTYAVDATYTVPGEHEVVFRASDDDNHTSQASLSILVVPNTPPTVDVGKPVMVNASTMPWPLNGTAVVSLHGSADDPDERPLGEENYEWTVPASATHDGEARHLTGSSAEHAFPVGQHQPVLTVRDANGATTSQSITVRVDDAIRLDASLTRAITGPAERPELSLLVQRDDGSGVGGAPVYLNVTHEPTGEVTSHEIVETNEDGLAVLPVPWDVGTGSPQGLNLPGEHTLTLETEVPSRAGAPIQDPERDGELLSFTVETE